MKEVVVAVYTSASAAETAVADLTVARVPSMTTVRQFVNDAGTHEGLQELRHRNAPPGDRIVAVTVDDRHASLVMDILGMQSPVSMTEAPHLVA